MFVRESEYEEMLKEGKPVKIADPTIINRLTDPVELSGLLNLALDSLHELLGRKEFTGMELTSQVAEKYMLICNPVAYFVNNYFGIDTEGKIKKADAYDMYVKWCHWKNIAPESYNRFSRVLARTYQGIVHTEQLGGVGQQAYFWVRLNWNVRVGEFVFPT